MPTQPVEDYVKAIYELHEREERVTTSALARRMDVTPASATSMIKKLAALGLAAHEPYQGVVLAPAGERMALELIRHHRLVESFLVRMLGVPWDEVHEEAEAWEHVLSERLEDRIDSALDFPTTDPHGAPIPGRDGSMEERETVPMEELERGQSGVVAEVSDHDPALLRYVGELGLVPGAEVDVVAVAPFDGPVTVRVGGGEHALGREVARHLLVTDVRDAA
jgi:DtxR family Mn-dependent transcriptional regulator